MNEAVVGGAAALIRADPVNVAELTDAATSDEGDNVAIVDDGSRLTRGQEEGRAS